MATSCYPQFDKFLTAAQRVARKSSKVEWQEAADYCGFYSKSVSGLTVKRKRAKDPQKRTTELQRLASNFGSNQNGEQGRVQSLRGLHAATQEERARLQRRDYTLKQLNLALEEVLKPFSKPMAA